MGNLVGLPPKNYEILPPSQVKITFFNIILYNHIKSYKYICFKIYIYSVLHNIK
jgi:hypothetical protein